MTPWVRLWREMPHDPKFRAIAKKAGRPVSDVIAVFITMMTSADEDGCIGSWDADDTAAGLDLDTSIVIAIRDAMVGKVIEGNALMGWKKRRPSVTMIAVSVSGRFAKGNARKRSVTRHVTHL